jgi:hypothetical protein
MRGPGWWRWWRWTTNKSKAAEESGATDSAPEEFTGIRGEKPSGDVLAETEVTERGGRDDS